jgi:MFS family permease
MISRLITGYFSHYKNISRNTALVLASIFMFSFSYACIAFLPLYLHQSLHYSIAKTGIVLSTFGVGTIIASYYGGKLCDKFSAYHISIASILFYCIVLVIAYFISQPDWLVSLVLVFLGAAFAIFTPASRIYLMRITPATEHARINGIRYMLYNIGTALSFGAAGWIIQGNYRRVFILAAIFCLISAGIYRFLPSQAEKANAVSVPAVKANFWQEKFLLLMLASYFLGMLIYIQVNSSYTLFLSNQYHLTAHSIASLFILNSVLIVLFQVALVNIFKNISQIILMCIGSAVMGLGFFLLLGGQSYTIAVVSMLIITIGEMLFIPVSQNLIYQSAPEGLKGYYMGIYQALYALTIMLTPLFSSFALAYNANGMLLWSSSLIISLIPIALCIQATKQNIKLL